MTQPEGISKPQAFLARLRGFQQFSGWVIVPGAGAADADISREVRALLDIAEAAQRAKDFADEKAGELARVGNWYEAKQLTIVASNLDRALAALDAADHE